MRHVLQVLTIVVTVQMALTLMRSELAARAACAAELPLDSSLLQMVLFARHPCIIRVKWCLDSEARELR